MMGWLMMNCPEFTASQFAFNFALLTADIYRSYCYCPAEKTSKISVLLSHMLRVFVQWTRAEEEAAEKVKRRIEEKQKMI